MSNITGLPLSYHLSLHIIAYITEALHHVIHAISHVTKHTSARNQYIYRTVESNRLVDRWSYFSPRSVHIAKPKIIQNFSMGWEHGPHLSAMTPVKREEKIE